MNYFGRELPVFLANLHTHSTNSDGMFTPGQIVRLYADAGYDCLALTDHGRTNDLTPLQNDRMTLLSGIELHPAGPRNRVWHLLALNVPHGFPGEFAAAQEAIDAVNAVGGLCFVAHPYWCGFTSAEVMTLAGYAGIEVYNTSTRYIGKEFNMNTWDEILDSGVMASALAVDDVHRPPDFFRGWTMICAPDRSPEALVTALKQGDFYATMGPEITRMSYEDGIFSAEFSPVVEAILCSNGSAGLCAEIPDRHYRGEGARTTTHATFAVRDGLRNSRYFRLQLRDSQGRCAWSNPVRI